MAKERIQKLMARAGIGSRRACEDVIRMGRVTLNGATAELGMQADIAVDDLRVDGKKLGLPETAMYVVLNKPRGVISDEDVEGNKVRARDMIPLGGHLYPVGRLDVQSEGLLLFTNDGEMAYKMTHPSFEHPRIYQVVVEGLPTDKTLNAWRRGVDLDGQRTAPAKIRRLSKYTASVLLEVTMIEGRKRQIRNVAAVLGHPVLHIRRIQIGPIKLGDLPEGEWRHLSPEEVESLRAIRKARPRRRTTGVPRRSSAERSRRPQQYGKAVSKRRSIRVS